MDELGLSPADAQPTSEPEEVEEEESAHAR